MGFREMGAVTGIVLLTACAASRQAGPVAAPPGAAASDTIPRVLTIPDTEVTVYGDAANRTVMYIGRLQTQVARYSQERGRLPIELKQVSTDPQRLDAWGGIIAYSPSGNTYELRSGGADRVFGNADDVVVGGLLGRLKPCQIRMPEGRVIDLSRESPVCPGPASGDSISGGL